MRVVLLLHRYLGIAVGTLMLLWCLSGLVMMYVSYPALDESVRLRALAPIDWSGCCKSAGLALASTDQPEVEMLDGVPVLTSRRSSTRPINLLTGFVLGGISAQQASAVARRFTTAEPPLLGLIDHDQWTVAGDFNSQRPLYLFALGDEAQSELYVSSITGRAVQITTGRQRFWNRLGSVPHWLYFTGLRRNAILWSQVMIYASLLGCFLTGVGIYLGVYQLAVQPKGRWSPYRGFNLWHHIAGLIFGIFALTWVLSGLLSMNPWGWLEGSGAQAESAQLRGTFVAPAAPGRRPAIARGCAPAGRRVDPRRATRWTNVFCRKHRARRAAASGQRRAAGSPACPGFDVHRQDPGCIRRTNASPVAAARRRFLLQSP